MITLIALRNLAHRPLRSLFLLFGYSLGVGVMIVLLAIGQAMLAQARDEKLVGGGQVTVLPEGRTIEVLPSGISDGRVAVKSGVSLCQAITSCRRAGARAWAATRRDRHRHASRWR